MCLLGGQVSRTLPNELFHQPPEGVFLNIFNRGVTAGLTKRLVMSPSTHILRIELCSSASVLWAFNSWATALVSSVFLFENNFFTEIPGGGAIPVLLRGGTSKLQEPRKRHKPSLNLEQFFRIQGLEHLRMKRLNSGNPPAAPHQTFLLFGCLLWLFVCLVLVFCDSPCPE